jgi:hypothetical protein
MAPSGARLAVRALEREFVVGGAVLVFHGGDLAGEAATERVHAGAVAALFRLGTR